MKSAMFDTLGKGDLNRGVGIRTGLYYICKKRVKEGDYNINENYIFNRRQAERKVYKRSS